MNFELIAIIANVARKNHKRIVTAEHLDSERLTVRAGVGRWCSTILANNEACRLTNYTCECCSWTKEEE